MNLLYCILKKTIILAAILFIPAGFCNAQAFIKTTDLFKRQDYTAGRLEINQDPAIDTLLSRYILASRKNRTIEGTQGMEGFRIQIYYSSVRQARDESAKARAEFIARFPDIVSYAQYQEPGYFMVRAGNYRTRTEGHKYLLMVRKEFPNAYLVPAIINFPDQDKK
ncbi:MAG: hypothetical protein A2V64_05655 [Bacteroidetes bacterium RBG_13_43_22]|nr:MAG: hypothetical protein A2V64_05655 [Bacteroidetes bacterium RBG_13_43_22]